MANLPFFTTFQPNNHVAEDFDLLKLVSFPSNYLLQHPFADQCSAVRDKPGYFDNIGISSQSGAFPTNKVIHKLIEKQRRKDMNSLCSQLRSLLPQERLQGKRSLSDQLLEAVNYVRHLEQQIKDLTNERDNTKTGSICSEGVEFSKTLSSHESDAGFASVKINSLGSAAFQISINTFKSQFAFSDLVVLLDEEGLQIVSSASSSINERVFHTIHIKVSNPNSTNIDTLNVKLWELLK